MLPGQPEQGFLRRCDGTERLPHPEEVQGGCQGMRSRAAYLPISDAT